MKRQTPVKTCIAGVVTLLILITISACGLGVEATLEEAFQRPRASAQDVRAEDLESGFLSPPNSAKPRTWWHWMNGNISEEGITLDLEAMKQVGIGGVHHFQISDMLVGPITYGTPENLRLVKFAISEADRLGLEFTMHNCPGFTSSCGPWITPELSMQELVWTETFVSGGERIDVTLPQPRANLGYYRDAFVLAFPSPAEGRLSKVTSSSGPVDMKLLAGTDPSQGVEVSPASSSQPAFLLLEYAEPFEARSITISSVSIAAGDVGGGFPGGPGSGFGAGESPNPMTLEASDDGVQFRKVCDISVAGGGGFGGGDAASPTTTNFTAVQAKYFRLVLPEGRRITELQLSATGRIVNWRSKANFSGGGGGFGGSSQEVTLVIEEPSGPVIDPGSVLDITQYMDGQGRLNWQAPAGNWTILRMGHTSNGMVGHPTPVGGDGLEVDKFSREAMDYHFDQMFGELLASLAPLTAKGLTGSLIDSYEVGLQNWTAEFPQEFEQRRGYDLRNYLPAMTGRVVGSVDISDRFLWDVRRTQDDMMAEYYHGRFAELCKQHGMKSYVEPYGSGPFESIQAGSKIDVPMGEFWIGRGGGGDNTIKMAASIAHLYGKPVVGAESFTSQSRWMEYPYSMKAQGDLMYTQGLSQVIFHHYAHQPHPDAVPGMAFGPFGCHFTRTNTWFYDAGPWLEYLARCQYMLQQGLFVADLVYFQGGDDLSGMGSSVDIAFPQGYGYDQTNEEAIIEQMNKVENGRIILPDGMSYGVLIVPNQTTMTLDLLRKLRDLVEQGTCLVVSGPKPKQLPSLVGYPAGDAEVRGLADELWGNLNGTTITERAFGKGRVFWGVPLDAVLDRLNIPPDFEFTSRSGSAEINYIHRRVGDSEIYFVANNSQNSEELVCTFRVNGKRPEFWDAATGEVKPVEVYELVEGRVRVPVQLDPAGSVLVVFRSPAPSRHLQAIEKDGVTIAGTEPFPMPTIAVIDETETLSTQAGFGIQAMQPFEMPDPQEPLALELAGGEAGKLLVWQNGSYSLLDSESRTSLVEVSGIDQPVEIAGPWRVSFQPNRGAPSEVSLNELISWTDHSNEGVKYFSGTATYTKRFNLAADAIADGKRLYLDLGKVDVIAEVLLNGQNLGILWKPPFRVDITDVVRAGDNDLEIRVTNLWPNRLIGDEQLPPENEYGSPDTNSDFRQQNVIMQWPEWYLQGEPKPQGGRVTFTAYKHYSQDDPLLESGLIGPVLLRTAVPLALDY